MIAPLPTGLGRGIKNRGFTWKFSWVHVERNRHTAVLILFLCYLPIQNSEMLVNWNKGKVKAGKCFNALFDHMGKRTLLRMEYSYSSPPQFLTLFFLSLEMRQLLRCTRIVKGEVPNKAEQIWHEVSFLAYVQKTMHKAWQSCLKSLPCNGYRTITLFAFLIKSEGYNEQPILARSRDIIQVSWFKKSKTMRSVPGDQTKDQGKNYVTLLSYARVFKLSSSGLPLELLTIQ